MNGMKRASEVVVVVVVALFTSQAQCGVAPFVRVQRAAQGTESNIVNGGGNSGPCPKFCPLDYTPVCGSDGVTYTNPCTLSMAVCRDSPTLTAAYMGVCDLRPSTTAAPPPPSGGAGNGAGSTCKESCTKIFDPVCGSDGATYSNKCQLELAACLLGGGLTVAAEGECAKGGSGSQGNGQVDLTGGSASTGPGLEIPECSQPCTRIFLPVCGSDGVTYNNLCLLERVDCESRTAGGPGVTLVSESACDQATREDNTVSGSSGDTTQAVATSCQKQCTRIFLPVCGSDGANYNNLCLLEIADCESKAAGGPGVILASESACAATEAPKTPTTTEKPVCSQECARIFFPVCGSDGGTYDNQCLLEVADCQSRAAGGPSVIVVSEGACGDQVDQKDNTVSGSGGDSCLKQCTRIFLPVCGSDGATYNNLCLLEIADCESKAKGGPGVTLVSESACEAATEAPKTTATTKKPACSQECTRIFLPVCGNDGVTYDNLCLLEVVDCESRGAGGPGVTRVSEGACAAATEAPKTPSTTEKPVCSQECARIFFPVCGSDGSTYDNQCLLEVADCQSRAAGGPSVIVASEGACADSSFDVKGSGCREDCSMEYEPVCGSDGRTYDNECVLDASNCGRWARKEQGVYLVDEGPCEGDAGAAPDRRPSFNMLLPSSLSSNSQQLSSPSSHSPPQHSSLDSPPQLSFPDPPPPPPVCSEACTREFRPVCGSDGLTYNNPCGLEVANCKSRARGGLAIEKTIDGPCVAALPQGPVCETNCDRRYRPVCGSDGETYSNECLLQHADCLNPFASITVAHIGPCQRLPPVGAGPSAGLPSLPPPLPVESGESSSEEEELTYAYPIPV